MNYKKNNNKQRNYKPNNILPPKYLLEEYEQIAPGSAEKIIDMVDIEQDHRHKFENKSLQAYIINYRIGQILSTINLMIIFYAAFYAYQQINDKMLAYAIIFAGYILQVIFIISNKSRKRFAERTRSNSKKYIKN
jgi:uncharacterized membrane protein